MEEEHHRDAGGQIAAEAIARVDTDVHRAADQHGEQRIDRHAADETELLGHDRKDEVGALLRQVPIAAVRTSQVALADQTAGTDRGHRLDDVPSGAARVHVRVGKHDQPHDLVVLQDPPRDDRGRERDHQCR